LEKLSTLSMHLFFQFKELGMITFRTSSCKNYWIYLLLQSNDRTWCKVRIRLQIKIEFRLEFNQSK